MGKILCATRGGEGSQRMQDAVIALAQSQGDELVFLFVVDISFLNPLSAPVVVDIEQRLEDMGRFELVRAKERAASQGVEAQGVVRRGRLRTELISVARELGAHLIVFGRPVGETAVFEEETLEAFASAIEDETGIEVRCL